MTFLPGHRRLGNGLLFDGPDRLARHMVKDVAEALLAHLCDALTSFPFTRMSISQVPKAGRSPTTRGGPSENARYACRSALQADGTCRAAIAGAVTMVILGRRAKWEVNVAELMSALIIVQTFAAPVVFQEP